MPLLAKKKLLVLDVNGFLLDTYFSAEKQPDRPADGKVNSHFVYRRPYCNEFLEFCFENFEVGIWSSAQRHNVDKFVDFIFGNLKSKLLFSWHQTECTDTGLKAPDNRFKPVFLKELSKIWNKVKPNLPWEKGDYGPFNTLLIDDSPYKALRNPPHTAVFPYPYKVSNDPDDSLGGAMLNYLEGLVTASNVQHYVKHHPFGQPPISKESPNWYLYRKILLPTENQDATWAPSCQEYELQIISLENRAVGLQSANRPHSESRIPIANQKKKHGLHLARSTDQYSVPCMEKEENFVVEAAMPNMETSKPLEDRAVGLQSANRQHSELSLPIVKRKKKHGLYLATSTDQYSVPCMEKEENFVVEAAMSNLEKSKPLEDRAVGLQSANRQHSESSLPIAKRKKKHPCMEKEENFVVEAAMPNMGKSKPLEDRAVGLQSANRQHSESSLPIAKRKKKHGLHLTTSTDQYSVTCMEKEENFVVEAAMPNMEKSKPLEDRAVGLQSANRQHSESSLPIAKRKKHGLHLATSTDQYSVPCMEKEDNFVVDAAMPNMGKSKPLEDREVGLQSDKGQHLESSLPIAKRKKHGLHLATSTDKDSVPCMEKEENFVPNMEKSKPLEDREVGLQSDKGHHLESSLPIAKRKKKHRLHLATSTDQESVPCMEKEENFVVEAAMPNMENSKPLEDREVGSESDKGQHSELRSCIGKRKKNRVHLTTGTNQYSIPCMDKKENGVAEAAMANKGADLLSYHGEPPEFGLAQKTKRKKNRVRQTTGTNQCSVPQMEKEKNGVAEAAMGNMEKSKGMTRASYSQEHESYNLFWGDKDADLLSDHGESPEFVLAQKTEQKKKNRAHLITGTSQCSVPQMEKEENGVAEAAMVNMEKSKGMTLASLSQAHESYNLFRGDKDADLLSDYVEPTEFGLAQKRKHKFYQATSISRESAPDMGYKNSGLAKKVETCTAMGNGIPMASFSQEHKAHNMLPKDEVAARTDEDPCGNNSSTKSGRKFCDRNNFRVTRHFNKGHHYNSSHFSKYYSNRQSSSHSQMNRYGGSQASYFPGRQFQENWGHQNGANTRLQTQVAQGGLYASNNMYGSNAVHANIRPYQRGGYINYGQVLRSTRQGHMWGGFQYRSHGQSCNASHIRSTVLQGQGYNPNQGATELQGPGHNWNCMGGKVIQSPLPSFLSHE